MAYWSYEGCFGAFEEDLVVDGAAGGAAEGDCVVGEVGVLGYPLEGLRWLVGYWREPRHGSMPQSNPDYRGDWKVEGR